MYQCSFDSWPIGRSYFNVQWTWLSTHENNWGVKRIDNYQFLEGFIFGCWWGCLEYIQDVFLVGCTLFGRTRVVAHRFFFHSSGVPSSVLHGLQAMCFETSWNILTWVRNKESSNVRYLRSLWTREISLCSCCWLGSSDLASLSSFIFTDLDVEGSGCHAHGRVHWRGSTPGESFWTTLISEPWSFYSRKNGQWPS